MPRSSSSSWPSPSRRPLLLTATAALVALAVAPAADVREPPPVRPTQELVRLLTSHTVAPRLHDRSRVSTVHAWRPITGGPTVLPLVGRARTADGVRWLRVMLPGRPNGRTGWLRARETVLTTTSWHVVVQAAGRRVRVYRRGRLVRTFKAIVGKASTPTPRGRFFVEESIRMLPGSVGAPPSR